MPYLDGIYRVKKIATPKEEVSEAPKVRKLFNWKKLLIISIVTLFLVSSGFATAFAYPKVKNSADILNGISNGKYLILFQNNNELRPSGGFLGSFAVAETKDARLSSIYFDSNIYKRDDAFSATNFIAPPEALKRVSSTWTMRDANWAIDYSEAAQKVAWFYNQEGGTPVDGVIAIDTTFFENILKIVGPVELQEYKTTITAENFAQNIQYKIEKEYFNDPRNWSINEPKNILKDLMMEIFTRVQNKKYLFDVAKTINASLSQKHILLYFNNQEMENIVKNKNWGGVVQEVKTSDYLFINYANLGINKSSLKVKEDLALENVNLGNKNVDKLTITRTNESENEWPYGDNINYVRIAVPKGAQILSLDEDGRDIIKDVNITEENNKTVFGFWLATKVQTSKVWEISYELPSQFTSQNYSLYFQKQAGTRGDDLQVISGSKLIFKGFVDQDKIVK